MTHEAAQPDPAAPSDAEREAMDHGDARPPTPLWVRVVVALWLLVSQFVSISIAFTVALFNGFLALLVESIRAPNETMTNFSRDVLTIGTYALVIAATTAIVAWLLFVYRHHKLAALVSGLPLLVYGVFVLVY